MAPSPDELWQVLGRAARIWIGDGALRVEDDHWTAFSGQRSVSYNLACCRSARVDVLVEGCLEPTLELGKPAIIMLAGPGLATAQRLVEQGWVTVGALPLMALSSAAPWSAGPSDDGVVTALLTGDDLPAARELLADSYFLDDRTAAVAMPDRALDHADQSIWGCFADGRLVSCVTTVMEDGLVVIWSMATSREYQGRGYGRHLLDAVFTREFGDGAAGALLHSSVAGERLYRQLGFSVVEYLQLWSRPRWVLGAS
jgi:ribosomal protein S18 acetylase RimI-like enzyme